MHIEMMKGLEVDLNKDTLRTISLIFLDAIKVYKELTSGDKKDVFSGAYFESIKGKLLGYIINRAFDPKLLSLNLTFNLEVINLPFGQKMPKLVLNNTILTISKVMDKESLPSKSKYKLEYARGNDLIANQFKFDLDKDFGIKNTPYYGIIAYEYKEHLKSLNILIPDSEFKNIIKTINIPIVHEYENIELEDKNEHYTKLVETVSNDIKLKVIE